MVKPCLYFVPVLNLPYEKCKNLALRKHCDNFGMFINTWPVKKNTADLYTHHQEQ